MSAYEIETRRAALRPLDRAARRALVAACSPEVWPPRSRSRSRAIASAAMTDQLPETLLITLTGKDRPGVTSSIFATLSRAGSRSSTSSRSCCAAG